MTHRNGAIQAPTSTPPRLRTAAGRKIGRGPLVTEPPMTQADIDAHAQASYVRQAAR